MGAGCTVTQAPTETTMSTSTSTTNDLNPVLKAGYCCSNEEGCTADVRVRDRQKPTEAKPQPSLKNE